MVNKTIDADLNTITNIDDGNIKAGANINRAKLASGSPNHVIINDGAGVLSSEAQLAITRGGTGQSTQTAAFDALAPSLVKGDIIVYNGTDNVRLPVGLDSQVITADSTQPTGLKYSNSAVADNSITEFKLTTSVAGNGLTGGNGVPLAVVVDNSTIEIVADTLRVKDLGITAAKIANTTITAAKIANATITGTQVSSNINLPGNTVQENGKNVVVSNTNASASLSVVRGYVDAVGGIISGEGFSVTNPAAGQYTITYTTAFVDNPAVVGSAHPPFPASTILNIPTAGTTAFTVYITNTAGSPSSQDFTFISIGQRS